MPGHDEIEQTVICIMCATVRPKSQVFKVGKGRNTRCKVDLRAQYGHLSDRQFEKQVWKRMAK